MPFAAVLQDMKIWHVFLIANRLRFLAEKLVGMENMLGLSAYTGKKVQLKFSCKSLNRGTSLFHSSRKPNSLFFNESRRGRYTDVKIY